MVSIRLRLEQVGLLPQQTTLQILEIPQHFPQLLLVVAVEDVDLMEAEALEPQQMGTVAAGHTQEQAGQGTALDMLAEMVIILARQQEPQAVEEVLAV